MPSAWMNGATVPMGRTGNTTLTSRFSSMAPMSTSPEPIHQAPTPLPSAGGRRWVQRADGDRRALGRLRMLESEGVIVLNDRRAPGAASSPIKRIAISSGGVFVLDAKHVKGLVTTRRSGPVSNLGPDELHVGRRNCTLWIEQVAHQMDVVRDALEAMVGGSDVPVHAMLCLTRAEWGVASPVEIREVCVAWPQLITGRVQAGGLMDSPTVREVAGTLADRLPAT